MAFLASWCLLSGFALTTSAKQAEPVLPLPREVRPMSIIGPSLVVDPFFQPDPYWRMRLYTRDRYGYLRPKVIYGPEGAFYPLTGQPYPYTSVKEIR